MSLPNTKKRSFVDRTDNYSTHASRRGVNLLGWEEDEELTIQDEINCLNKKIDSLQDRLQYFPKGSPDRKALGMEIHQAKEEIHQKKKKMGYRKYHGDIGHYMLDILKERITKPEWELLKKQAIEAQQKDEVQHDD